MANTHKVKILVEPYVRTWLANKFGKPFRSEFLRTSRIKDRPAKQEFDTVSEDKPALCELPDDLKER